MPSRRSRRVGVARVLATRPRRPRSWRPLLPARGGTGAASSARAPGCTPRRVVWWPPSHTSRRAVRSTGHPVTPRAGAAPFLGRGAVRCSAPVQRGLCPPPPRRAAYGVPSAPRIGVPPVAADAGPAPRHAGAPPAALRPRLAQVRSGPAAASARAAPTFDTPRATGGSQHALYRRFGPAAPGLRPYPPAPPAPGRDGLRTRRAGEGHAVTPRAKASAPVRRWASTPPAARRPNRDAGPPRRRVRFWHGNGNGNGNGRAPGGAPRPSN